MNIKDNIDKEVLSAVAKNMNVTEDLLVKMISTDLYNIAITTFSIAIGTMVIAILLGLLSYFRFKKDNSDFLAEAFAFASGIIIVLSILIFALSGAYSKPFEVFNNHEYAVVKEINEMYDEMQNPSEEVNE